MSQEFQGEDLLEYYMASAATAASISLSRFQTLVTTRGRDTPEGCTEDPTQRLGRRFGRLPMAAHADDTRTTRHNYRVHIALIPTGKTNHPHPFSENGKLRYITGC